jgi:hypothetical protein
MYGDLGKVMEGYNQWYEEIGIINLLMPLFTKLD